MIKILGYIASIITILSVYFTGNKNIIFWYLSIINQFIWGFIGYKTHQPYLIFMMIGLQILNIRGLWKWSKNENSYKNYNL